MNRKALKATKDHTVNRLLGLGLGLEFGSGLTSFVNGNFPPSVGIAVGKGAAYVLHGSSLISGLFYLWFFPFLFSKFFSFLKSFKKNIKF